MKNIYHLKIMKLLVFLINHKSGIYVIKDFQKIKKENHPVRTLSIYSF